MGSYYLDSNSKSPLSDSVKNYLLKGDFDFGNPGNIHQSGRKAKEQLDQVSSYMSTLFGLKNSHRPLFHSGATEGVNTIIKGMAGQAELLDERVAFFYSSVDHPVAHALASYLEINDHLVQQFQVDENGAFDRTKLIEMLSSAAKIKNIYKVILNYQVVNSVTGVIWPLRWASEIKQATNCIVSVDYTQAPGKIEQWDALDCSLDAYHLSGHKFGALPGVGFSLIQNSLDFFPLIIGGGQQEGLRSGSENVLGAYTMMLALKELVDQNPIATINSFREELEQMLVKQLGERGVIVAANSEFRATNTIYFALKDFKAQELVVALDLAGIEVSSGTACSSGIADESSVLQAMGLADKKFTSGVRISLPPSITASELQTVKSSLSNVLGRFLD